jgi:hypothetical protein
VLADTEVAWRDDVRDTQLYQQLLGLAEPWSVIRVELSMSQARVDVWVEHPRRSRFGCPECTPSCSCMITPRSGPGGIWTAASS